MNSRLILTVITITVVICSSGLTFQRQRKIRPSLSGPSRISQWELDGNGSWQVADGKLQLTKAGVPGGPIRRPAALAIFKSEPFRKVTVELEVRSLAAADVLKRDVDLVLGYESPTSFYYVHLSAVTDDVHNGIFIVSNSDRRRIDSGKGIPHLKDQAWHRVRATRDGLTGQIEVFFDDSGTVDTFRC